MIVSEKYKYIFVAIPHTASTVIEDELCKYYGGRRVRRKHSLPVLLPKSASGYKIVGGVREPLSDMSSQFYKLKNDHLGLYSAQLEGVHEYKFTGIRGLRYFKAIRSGEMKFSDYIRSASYPFFVSKIEVCRSKYTYIYKMEELEIEFPKIIDHLALTLVRPLPLKNITKKKIEDSSADTNENLIPARISLGYDSGNVNLWRSIQFSLFKYVRVLHWWLNESLLILKNKGFYNLESATLEPSVNKNTDELDI